MKSVTGISHRQAKHSCLFFRKKKKKKGEQLNDDDELKQYKSKKYSGYPET